MNIRLKRQLYKELVKYSRNRRQAKIRYRELMRIIFNKDELIKVIKYYKTLNQFYS